MKDAALKELLYKMADDQLILGHRNSEWTGLGPVLEEDIAFSSMAQDKLGHSLAFYGLLQDLGEPDPDTLAFRRPAEAFRCCQFVELPIGEYDFSLIRHFLFDQAEAIRFSLLAQSTYAPLVELVHKLQGELKYHLLHANVMIKKLGNATPESISRLQGSLETAFPYALGMFEPSPFEAEIIAAGLYAGEETAREAWLENIQQGLAQTALVLPDPGQVQPVLGGRLGHHSTWLPALLAEMSEVIGLDPEAKW
jgi:ring-1,2-phenylacetyl-CoA epoxidase subunit PaaC